MPTTPQHRYFIAFALEGAAKAKVTRLRNEISKKFDLHAALKTPPHITLKYPFDTDNIEPVIQALTTFTKNLKPFPFTLKNFNHFDDRVWYVDVNANPKHRPLQNRIIKLVYKALSLPPEPHDQYRTPHVTLAYKDLTAEKFALVEKFLANKSINLKIRFNNISILKLVNNKWRIYRKFKMEHLPAFPNSASPGRGQRRS